MRIKPDSRGFAQTIRAPTARVQMAGTGPAMTVRTQSGRRGLLPPALIPMWNPGMPVEDYDTRCFRA